MSGEEDTTAVAKKTSKKVTKTKEEKPLKEEKPPKEEKPKKEKVPKVPKERKPSQSRAKVEAFWGKLINLDHATATRFIIIGILIAIIFGSIALTSSMLATTA
jgi:hypothetical protein